MSVKAEVSSATPDVPFGRDLLPLWMMGKGYTNLNFGSFGSVPRQVMNKRHEWEQHVELNPDNWFRYEVFDTMDRIRSKMAEYVGAQPEDLVFVENASAGVNAVLRSLQPILKPGAKILILDTAYGMVKNVLKFLEEKYHVPTVKVHVGFPTEKAKILDAVRAALDQNPEIAIASFSHITSVPALILPVEELIHLCQSRGILVLIDGAHALGHIPLNMTTLNPDFYVANGHKWMFTPKGSAILWARKDRQNLLWPPTISDEGQGKSHFQLTFSYEGTSDYSSYLAFEEALAFRSQFGEENIMNYIHKLAVDGGNILAAAWGTEILVPDHMIGAMVNVRIPSTNATLMNSLPKSLLEKYNIWVPVFPLEETNIWYTRVSAQIFNDLEDFRYLAKSVLALLDSQ